MINIDTMRADVERKLSADRRRTEFLIALLMATGHLDHPEAIENAADTNFSTQLAKALGPTIRTMSEEKRHRAIFFLGKRREDFARSLYSIERNEFRKYFRVTREQDAAVLLTMHWPALHEAIKDLPMDPLPADVMAFVIWATLAYIYGQTDRWDVDALRAEYPWIPEFERTVR